MNKVRKNKSFTPDLHALGLKITKARVSVLNLFAKSAQRHMSVEEVYKRLEAQGDKVPWPTLYRVLSTFEKAGLIHRHNIDENHAIYELNEQGDHDHMVCLRCGRMEEFYDADLERRQTRIARKSGFSLRTHALYLYVDCQYEICPHGSSVKEQSSTTTT